MTVYAIPSDKPFIVRGKIKKLTKAQIEKEKEIEKFLEQHRIKVDDPNVVAAYRFSGKECD